MREAKFRARYADGQIKKKTGEWEYGTPGYGNGDGKAYINRGGRLYAAIEVDPETIGEFTGLRDANGKKIYEGDIVINSGQNKGFVKFNIGSFYMETKNKHDRLLFSRFLPEYIDNMECGNVNWLEVIGNIHENPELIES